MNEIQTTIQILETGEPSGGGLSPQGLASSRRYSVTRGVSVCDKAIILWDKRNHQFEPVLVDRVSGEWAEIELEGTKRTCYHHWLYADSTANHSHVEAIQESFKTILREQESIANHLKAMTQYKPKENPDV